MNRHQSEGDPFGMPNCVQIEKRSRPVSASATSRETSDTYRHEIARQGDFRVIICRDGMQLILQRRITPRQGRAVPRWKALGYFSTRQALLRLWHAKIGALCAQTDALPDRIKRWARR